MEVKPLAWTPEQIERFWTYWAQRPNEFVSYATRGVGKGVCKFLEQVTPLANCHILEYGAGPSVLASHLLQRGAFVSAVERAEEAVNGLNRRFHRDRFWTEARQLDDDGQIPWDDGSFDLVCCLATLEHLPGSELHAVLRELLRVLKPGGAVLFTTPNAESLRSQTVFCPDCCSEFHRWQHVRRWTSDSLDQHLSNHGFDVRFCGMLDFLDFQLSRIGIGDIVSPNFWWRLGSEVVWGVLDQLRPRPFPQGRRLASRLRRATGHQLAAVAYKPALPAEHRGHAAAA